MEILNYQSFANILARCRENPRYSAAVVFGTRDSFKLFVDEVKIKYPTEVITDIAKIVRLHQNSLIIQYENGSIIEVFVANPSSRGKRYHEILCNEDVHMKTLNQILLPMLISYKRRENVQDYDSEEELLERFAYLDSKYGNSAYMDQEQYHIGYDEAILDYFKSVGMTEIAEKFEKAQSHFWYA